MFEITRENEDALDYYMQERIAYPSAEYDFTFEHRFLIYHVCDIRETKYYAIDMKTNLTSEVCHRKTPEFCRDNYTEMIPLVLNSIKYTGDTRQLNPFSPDPFVLIDTIFRVVLPSNGYLVREDQISLCKDIYRGLTTKRVAICEAEVGVGKSLAYLIAAVCASKSGNLGISAIEPITITTSSIELQTALVNREIPKLSAALQGYGLIKKPLTVVLRKGREHYFCRLRYEEYLKYLWWYPKKYEARIQMLQNAGLKTGEIFDLDTVNLPDKVKQKVCVKGDCSYCRYRHTCSYANYIAFSLSNKVTMDFQITNHNLFLMSKLKSGLLRDSTCVIVDEAHKLKETAQDTFGEKVVEEDVNSYLNLVKIHRGETIPPEQFKNELDRAADLNANLFGILNSLSEETPLGKSSLVELPQQCYNIISELADTLIAIESLRDKVRFRSLISGRKIADSLRTFLKPSTILTWLDRDEEEIALCCCPKNIGACLLKYVWDRKRNHVLTSGTMSDGSSFDFFKREIGVDQIPRDSVLETTVDSPYDYLHNTRLYIPNGMPLPDSDNPKYIEALAKEIIALIDATNGHTAILFTSYHLLNAVYNLINPELKEYEVFKMSKAARTIIRDFKKSKNGVLFASGSMWEGVDCVGDCLSSVIIPRLPFPIRSAAMEAKKNASRDVPTFIADYAVPEMLIKLRQGAGRLIRSETDTGVLSILDARASDSGAYRKDVAFALRKYPQVNSLEEVREFMHNIKSPQYFEKNKEEEK